MSFVIIAKQLMLFGSLCIDGGQCSEWWLSSHIFTEVTAPSEKAQLLYAGCVHLSVDWLFWNLYGSYVTLA